MKNMNQQQFNNMFNKFFKGASAGSLLLLGLGYLALNSYYYGKTNPIQLMSGTMLLSSTSFPVVSPLKYSEKASILKSLCSRLQLSTMFRPDKTKFSLRLPTVICKVSSYQSVSSSTLRSTCSTPFIPS